MARPVPIMSPVELVLGRLWLGPATLGDIRRAYRALAAEGAVIVDWGEVEAVIRGLRSQGLVYFDADGRLALARERLHPMACAAARLAAGDLEARGVV